MIDKRKGVFMKDKIIQYFKQKRKSNCTYLGVEFEHFLINTKTFESYDYYSGVHLLMKKLHQNGWSILNGEKEKILGLEKKNNTITLEPAGQIEISLDICESVDEINTLYLEILNEIENCLEDNQALVCLGYHPKSTIDSLKLLPKKRYDQMYKHFMKRGELSHYMMKGTASTQVTIDYRSEEDFIKKFRVANFLSPFIYRIFDGAPIFEGGLYSKNTLRMDIWDKTDPIRTGVIPNALDHKAFGFNEYAAYLLSVPPIFIKKNHAYTYTGDQLLKDLIQMQPVDEEAIEYFLGMVFPDVRVKGYIEIRMPDSLPHPYNMAVVTFIKGLFYNKENLEYYYQLSQNYSNEDVRIMKSKFKESFEFEYKGISTEKFVKKLLSDSKKGINKSEEIYLDNFIKILEEFQSISKYMKNLYKVDKKEFLKFISGGKIYGQN